MTFMSVRSNLKISPGTTIPSNFFLNKDQTVWMRYIHHQSSEEIEEQLQWLSRVSVSGELAVVGQTENGVEDFVDLYVVTPGKVSKHCMELDYDLETHELFWQEVFDVA